MKYLVVATMLCAFAAPALAEGEAEPEAPADAATEVVAGDAAKGEEDFKKCKSCHSIVAPDGTEVVKGGKTGPNLWGLDGKVVASTEGFKYGDSILAVNATGAVWNAEELAKYVADPSEWLEETLDDDKAKSKMTFKLPKGGEDMAAYLVSIK